MLVRANISVEKSMLGMLIRAAMRGRLAVSIQIQSVDAKNVLSDKKERVIHCQCSKYSCAYCDV